MHQNHFSKMKLCFEITGEILYCTRQDKYFSSADTGENCEHLAEGIGKYTRKAVVLNNSIQHWVNK